MTDGKIDDANLSEISGAGDDPIIDVGDDRGVTETPAPPGRIPGGAANEPETEDGGGGTQGVG